MTGISVTVSGARGEVDMELPAVVPLRTLLPALAWAYAGVDPDDVVVMVVARGRLDVDRSLAESGVRPGSVLNLFPRAGLAVRPSAQTVRGSAGRAGTVVSPTGAAVAVAERPAAPPDITPQPRLRLVDTELATPKAGLWAWRGAHGGAGVTTLARVLGGVEATDVVAGSLPIIVVTRTHARGLEAAQQLAAELDTTERAGGAPLLGLVLVPDAPGRLPPALQDLAHVVVGGYPRWWALRWSTELRFGDFGPDSLPRRVRRLGEDLNALALDQADEQRRAP
jgi:hypothetical protein